MNNLHRRDFLTRLTLATAAIATPGYRFSSVGRADEFAEVTTTHGRLKGARSVDVTTFKGIPYGGRISGDRRFRRPAPLEPWTGVRDALQFGAPAIQPSGAANPLQPKIVCSLMCGHRPATIGNGP